MVYFNCILSSLYNAFALFAQVVRHVLRGNSSHCKVLDKFDRCFVMIIAQSHMCMFLLLYLLLNFMNIIGVSNVEYIRKIAVMIFQCTNPI